MKLCTSEQMLFCLALGCGHFDEISPSMSEASWSEGCLPIQQNAEQLCAVWLGKPCYLSDRWFPWIGRLCLKNPDWENLFLKTAAVHCFRLTCWLLKVCTLPSITHFNWHFLRWKLLCAAAHWKAALIVLCHIGFSLAAVGWQANPRPPQKKIKGLRKQYLQHTCLDLAVTAYWKDWRLDLCAEETSHDYVV